MSQAGNRSKINAPPQKKPQSIVAPQEKIKGKKIWVSQYYSHSSSITCITYTHRDTYEKRESERDSTLQSLLFSIAHTAFPQQSPYAESRGRRGPRALKIKNF